MQLDMNWLAQARQHNGLSSDKAAQFRWAVPELASRGEVAIRVIQCRRILLRMTDD